jgi:hypothetical protein
LSGKEEDGGRGMLDYMIVCFFKDHVVLMKRYYDAILVDGRRMANQIQQKDGKENL